MDFTKDLKAGRKIAKIVEKKLKAKKVPVIFYVDEAVKEKCQDKTFNLSAYLRRCMEKLAASSIEKKTEKLYDDIIDETLSGD